MVEEMHQ